MTCGLQAYINGESQGFYICIRQGLYLFSIVSIQTIKYTRQLCHISFDSKKLMFWFEVWPFYCTITWYTVKHVNPNFYCWNYECPHSEGKIYTFVLRWKLQSRDDLVSNRRQNKLVTCHRWCQIMELPKTKDAKQIKDCTGNWIKPFNTNQDGQCYIMQTEVSLWGLVKISEDTKKNFLMNFLTCL